jgi:2-haloacid dehalogenase
MPNHRRYDAVIFDLLTALIDSWTLWNTAAGSAAQGLRWRRKYLELTYAAGAYRPYESIVQDAAIASGTEVAACARLFADWDRLAPWPETHAVLMTLSERVPLAVATNCSIALGAQAAALTGGRFVAVITAETAGAYKPRPEAYHAALAALKTRPERTLFVAGSAADVPGARGVGMPVYWHNRMRLPLVDATHPDIQAASLLPLLDLVR